MKQLILPLALILHLKIIGIDIAIDIALEQQLLLVLPLILVWIKIGIAIAIDIEFQNNCYWYCHCCWFGKKLVLTLPLPIWFKEIDIDIAIDKGSKNNWYWNWYWFHINGIGFQPSGCVCTKGPCMNTILGHFWALFPLWAIWRHCYMPILRNQPKKPLKTFWSGGEKTGPPWLFWLLWHVQYLQCQYLPAKVRGLFQKEVFLWPLKAKDWL